MSVRKVKTIAEWIMKYALGTGVLGGLVVSIGGFGFLVYQIWQIQRSFRMSSLATLNQQLHYIRTIFVGYPELRPYFYDGKILESDSTDYQRVLTVAEIYLNFLEHYAVNHSIFREENSSAWGEYVREIFRTNSIMKDMLRKRENMYSPNLLKLVKGKMSNCGQK